MHPGGKVHAFLALFANIRGKSAIFTLQTMRKVCIMPAPLRVLRMYLLVWQTSNSLCYTWHYPALARHREGKIHCEVCTVRERRAWREPKMVCHGRENSVRTWISHECAISSCAACTVREPFHPGIPVSGTVSRIACVGIKDLSNRFTIIIVGVQPS